MKCKAFHVMIRKKKGNQAIRTQNVNERLKLEEAWTYERVSWEPRPSRR